MPTGTPRSAGSRCVLWHAPGTVPPADLVTSLQRREVQISACTNPFAAIARACLLERDNDERTDDPQQRDALVLLLVCPRELDRAATVVDAAHRYAGRTACWWYDPSDNPRLRAVTDEDLDQWPGATPMDAPSMVIRPPERSESRPRLKLAGESTMPSPGNEPGALRPRMEGGG